METITKETGRMGRSKERVEKSERLVQPNHLKGHLNKIKRKAWEPSFEETTAAIPEILKITKSADKEPTPEQMADHIRGNGAII
jgi:hypothetical protein